MIPKSSGKYPYWPPGFSPCSSHLDHPGPSLGGLMTPGIVQTKWPDPNRRCEAWWWRMVTKCQQLPGAEIRSMMDAYNKTYYIYIYIKLWFMHISICDEQLLETQPCKNKQPKHYILALQIATRDQNSSTADWGWSSHAGFVPAGSNSNTIPQSNHKFFNIIGVIHHGLKFQWLLSGVWFDSDLLAVRFSRHQTNIIKIPPGGVVEQLVPASKISYQTRLW